MKKFKLLSTAILSAVLTACGGGGGGSDPVPTNPSSGNGSTNPTTPTTPTTPSTDLQTQIPTPTYSAGSAELTAFNLVNSERLRCGFGGVVQNAQLQLQAEKHADYVKQRWEEGDSANTGHEELPNKSGFYAATPGERSIKAGYSAQAGELISYYNMADNMAPAAYGNALVRSMLSTVYHQALMLDGSREVGLSVSYPVSGSKVASLVWNMGTPAGAAQQKPKGVVVYPCDGTKGVQPWMFGENPNPFTGLNVPSNNGQPIYVKSDEGTTIRLASATVTTVSGPNAGKTVPVLLYMSDMDPNKKLTPNQAFVVPLEPLGELTSYKVEVTATVNGAAVSLPPSTWETLKF